MIIFRIYPALDWFTKVTGEYYFIAGSCLELHIYSTSTTSDKFEVNMSNPSKGGSFGKSWNSHYIYELRARIFINSTCTESYFFPHEHGI